MISNILHCGTKYAFTATKTNDIANANHIEVVANALQRGPTSSEAIMNKVSPTPPWQMPIMSLIAKKSQKFWTKPLAKAHNIMTP